MREIKFRAWNKQINRMEFGAGDLLLRHDENRHSDIMQYTGLKDKNGTEIYEGDIIKGGYCKGVIEWRSAQWWVEPDLSDRAGTNLSMENELIEVIGNIYSDPDLIVNK